MADEPSRKSYPYLPSKNWWDLRRRFQQTMPARVDPNYLQTVLDIGEGHARNLIPQLRAVGLIDDTGKTTPLANDWRDDESYPTACEKILNSVYPQDLRDALPPPSPDQGATERWFSRTLGIGHSASTKMAAFYRLIASGDVTDQAAERTREAKQNGGAKRATAKPRMPKTKTHDSGGKAKVEKRDDGPSLHVDVQVHIPPDATPEQIDRIFAAMAKHLYKK
jgi:hypothetical protein